MVVRVKNRTSFYFIISGVASLDYDPDDKCDPMALWTFSLFIACADGLSLCDQHLDRSMNGVN